MHICVFSRQVFSQGVKGGMEIHGKLLSEGLVQKGCRVSVISTRHPSGKTYDCIQGVDFYYLKDTVFGSRRNGWPQESVKLFFHLNAKHTVDAVWSQSFDAYGLVGIGKSQLHVPVIPILQGCIHQEIVTFLVNVSKNRKLPLKILRSLAGLFYSYFVVQNRLLAFADAVIAPSYQVPKDIRRWFGSRASEKCVTIFNGIDTDHFHPEGDGREEIRSKYGLDKNIYLMLSAGRIIVEKGHQVAIDVLARVKRRLPGAKLMIVGEGENLQNLKDIVSEKGLANHVIFTGFVENDNMARYYHSCDLFLMPTLREEGLPFALIELMACQKPAIVSGIGGNLSVIKDMHNGVLVPAGNAEAMAAKVLYLHANSNLSKNMALVARQTAIEKFGVNQMVAKTYKVLHRCSQNIRSPIA